LLQQAAECESATRAAIIDKPQNGLALPYSGHAGECGGEAMFRHAVRHGAQEERLEARRQPLHGRPVLDLVKVKNPASERQA
jgi:hypothetical protein